MVCVDGSNVPIDLQPTLNVRRAHLVPSLHSSNERRELSHSYDSITIDIVMSCYQAASHASHGCGLLAGLSSRVVSASDCGVRGPRFESRR